MTNSFAKLNMAIEIVDLPMNSMVWQWKNSLWMEVFIGKSPINGFDLQFCELENGPVEIVSFLIKRVSIVM